MREELSPARPGRGRTAATPEGLYEPPLRVSREANAPVVSFGGEDGRQAVFDFARLPCPGLHEVFAAALDVKIGPVGNVRTRASAVAVWGAIGRFLRFLDTLPNSPGSPVELTSRHLRRFGLHRQATVEAKGAYHDVVIVQNLLAQDAVAETLPAELREYLGQRRHSRGLFVYRSSGGTPGYSDREFAALMAAARSDVAAIRDRLHRTERLLVSYATASDELTDDQRRQAAVLAEIERTGRVRTMHDIRVSSQARLPNWRTMVDLASELFITDRDLAPLLVVMTGVCGRNGETVKELPAEHTILDGRAVSLNIIKRRRGKAQSHQGVHWEIGPQSRQLHTPGGMYLLLHAMTRRSRTFSGTDGLWAIWTGRNTGQGHSDAFGTNLSRKMSFNHWAARHALMDDQGEPLEVTMNRVKTTVEVRRTIAAGGHLASASLTNTPNVSFLHYLRNDPRIRVWADAILTTAIQDAETSARTFRLPVLDAAATARLETTPDAVADELGIDAEKLKQAAAGDLDTAIASCLDIDHHPVTGQRCGESFLTCLRCPNVLVAERHLPMLLALADHLQAELGRRGVEDWCGRYGVTWLIVTRLVLPRFTPAQISASRRMKPAALPFGLLEPPRELL